MISVSTGTVGVVLRSKSLHEIMIRLSQIRICRGPRPLVLSQNEGGMAYLFGIAEETRAVWLFGFYSFCSRSSRQSRVADGQIFVLFSVLKIRHWLAT